MSVTVSQRLLKKVGLNMADVRSRYFVVGGKCELCGIQKELVLDHDHATDRPRGLLCWDCNLFLGTVERKWEGPILCEYLLKGWVR